MRKKFHLANSCNNPMCYVCIHWQHSFLQSLQLPASLWKLTFIVKQMMSQGIGSLQKGKNPKQQPNKCPSHLFLKRICFGTEMEE